jgi:hypothetical protein
MVSRNSQTNYILFPLHFLIILSISKLHHPPSVNQSNQKKVSSHLGVITLSTVRRTVSDSISPSISRPVHRWATVSALHGQCHHGQWFDAVCGGPSLTLSPKPSPRLELFEESSRFTITHLRLPRLALPSPL